MGPRASDLRRLYVSYVRPGGVYGFGTWRSFLTDTALSKLESCNSGASYIITGLPADTNAGYSRVEADLPTIKQLIEEEAAKTFSKYSEMSRNSHLRDLTLPPPRKRLKWSAGSEYCTKIGISHPSETIDKIQRERDRRKRQDYDQHRKEDSDYHRYCRGVPPPHCSTLSRSEEVKLHNLRANRCEQLQECKHRFGKSNSGPCPHCSEEDGTAIHYLIRCPKWQEARLSNGVHVGDRFNNPANIIQFAKDTGMLNSSA